MPWNRHLKGGSSKECCHSSLQKTKKIPKQTNLFGGEMDGTKSECFSLQDLTEIFNFKLVYY